MHRPFKAKEVDAAQQLGQLFREPFVVPVAAAALCLKKRNLLKWFEISRRERALPVWLDRLLSNPVSDADVSMFYEGLRSYTMPEHLVMKEGDFFLPQIME
jgi:hypothetical protein